MQDYWDYTSSLGWTKVKNPQGIWYSCVSVGGCGKCLSCLHRYHNIFFFSSLFSSRRTRFKNIFWHVADTLEANNKDVPFSALYLLEQNKLVLKSASAIPKGHLATPLEISLNGTSLFFRLLSSRFSCLTLLIFLKLNSCIAADDPCVWPAHSVMTSRTHVVVEGLEAKLGHLPGGLWPESSQCAVLMPILGAHCTAMGMLVLGINPRRALDDDYMYSHPFPLRYIITLIAPRITLQPQHSGIYLYI